MVPLKVTMKSFLLVLCYLLCFEFSQPFRIKRELITDNVHNYLMKYGYLSQGVDGAGFLRTEQSVKDAISSLQKFAGLPVTGDVDERTVQLLRRPRCGLPDVAPPSKRRKRYMLHQGPKWSYTNLTWSLLTKNLGYLNTYDVRLVLQKALDVWSRHSKLTFTEVDSHKAEIRITFNKGEHGDEYPFDGKGQVLAHAYYPGNRKGGEVHFDEDESWIAREEDFDVEGSTSLFHVAAHEFGHALGLQHSNVSGALMFPYYQGTQNGFDYELPDDDKLAIQYLYGNHVDGRQWDRNPYYPPVYNPTTQPTPRPTPRTRPTRPNYPQQYPKYPGKPAKPMHPEEKNPYHNKYPAKSPTRPHHRQVYPLNPDLYPRTTQRTATTTTEVYKERTHPPRRHPGSHWPGKETPNKKPDTCDTSYDAVAVIRREVFIFKDAYFWRIGDHGLFPGYPVEINRMWKDLPRNFTRVDAVYERPDNKIVFFIGKSLYVYTGNTLDRGYPKPIASLGLPQTLDKVDGATIWGHNGKTFFFSGNLYWRYDEDLNRVELDYPRLMDMWSGVGPNIDAVFQWKDGRTYFFKGKYFWKFDDQHMRVENTSQARSGPFWMGCKDNIEGYEPGDKAPYTDTISGASKHNNNLFIIILVYIILKIIDPLIT